jgi:hemoglobin
MKKDIENTDDIQLLVNIFYNKVKTDATIGYIFHNIIGEDWSHHLPIMYRFWGTVLLNQPGYTGNPIKKHIELDKKEQLKEEHYERWLTLWRETTDELFEGENADEIKNKAYLMLNLIKMKVEWARLGNAIQ